MAAMPKKISIADLLWLTLLVALLAAVAGAMFRIRNIVLQSAGAESQQNWDEWREAVQEGQNQEGPVQRRIPKSAEPPAIVLLRDHFGVCLVIALVLSSVLFGTFVLFVRGVMNSPGPPINSSSLPPESPSDDRR
jgi:hypothetical protein